MYRYALTWQVTAFMGLQSLLYYAALSWLPTIFQDRGTSAVTAGNLLALMGVGNLSPRCWRPCSLTVLPASAPWWCRAWPRWPSAWPGSLWAPVGTAPLWVLVLGLSQGSCLGLAIYFMMARAPDPGTAASLSAFAQSVGYLVASTGPLELGLLHSVTGGWGIPVAILLVLAVAGLGVGVLAARPIVLPGSGRPGTGSAAVRASEAPVQEYDTRVGYAGAARGPSAGLPAVNSLVRVPVRPAPHARSNLP